MTNGHAAWLAAVFLCSGVGCVSRDVPTSKDRPPITLTIGFGSVSGTETNPVVQNITHEVLVLLDNDGRPVPMLAEEWAVSDDGLTWRVTIRAGVTFHDGTPLTAEVVRAAVLGALPAILGPSYRVIESIEAASPTELVFTLRERLTFLPETLTMSIRSGNSGSGTGPFHLIAPAGRSGASRPTGRVELVANEKYHRGRPSIDRIVIEPYKTVRAAWADMLRGKVDMLYEVGADALNLVKPAKNTQLFTFQRPYALVAVLNVRKPALKSAAVRRALNAAINREEIVENGMGGHGRPADGPVWPDLWANTNSRPRFQYEPSSVTVVGKPLTLTFLYTDPSHERVALLVQRQLQSVGVNVELQEATIEDGLARAARGDFDAWLVDMGLGPGFSRQAVFWESGSAYALGGFSSAAVDAAFTRVRRAINDEEYKAGVLAFQHAIADDPPAIFLAWTERARAVSTRFKVPSEPGRDILRGGSVSLWRPAVMPQLASRN